MSELKNMLRWSASRIQTLDFCERQYYFDYYESWEGWLDEADDRKKQAYMLKKRTDVKAWIGEKTHEAIKQCVEKDMNMETVKDFIIREQITNKFDLSKRKLYRKGSRKIFGLIEHYRGQHLDDQLQEIIEKVSENFEAFCKSKYYNVILEAKRNKRLVYLDPGENFKAKTFIMDKKHVFAIPDICLEAQKRKFVILDWKTGKKDMNGDDDLPVQLMVYGLRLAIEQELDLQCDHIEAYNVYLPALEEQGGVFNRDHLEHAQNHIKGGIKRMQLYLEDVYNNIPKPEHCFKPTDSEKKCAKCRYSELCKKM